MCVLVRHRMYRKGKSTVWSLRPIFLKENGLLSGQFSVFNISSSNSKYSDCVISVMFQIVHRPEISNFRARFSVNSKEVSILNWHVSLAI